MNGPVANRIDRIDIAPVVNRIERAPANKDF